MLYVLLFLFGGLILFVVLNIDNSGPSKGYLPEINFTYLCGFPDYKEGVDVKLSSTPQEIIIDSNKKITFKEILNIEIKTAKQLIEKDKSILGRALVGGILLGPAGAVVGGLTGIGNFKKTKEVKILQIELKNENILILVLQYEVYLNMLENTVKFIQEKIKKG